MAADFLTLRIKRYHAEKEPPAWVDTFQVEARTGMNLLEALLRIQDQKDPTLSFRFSCRGAVCGSCAMKVNGELVLACRTQVRNLLGKAVFIEPLPYFPVIRDLIVDLSAFFEHYRKIEPTLHGKPVKPRSEYAMAEEERKLIDPFIQCILCGICFGACPAFKRDSKFLGPAILAKAYRFLIDSRDKRTQEILDAVNTQTGVWGCNTVFQCVKVCPKEVPPTHGIVTMRRRILKSRLVSMFFSVSGRR